MSPPKKSDKLEVALTDRMPNGRLAERIALPFSVNKLSVRQLIKVRLTRDVDVFHKANNKHYGGLVQPDGTKETRSGYLFRRKREINFDEQLAALIEAFEQRRLFIMLNGEMLDSLEKVVKLKAGAALEFHLLQPIHGG